jgi:hypothetical protein
MQEVRRSADGELCGYVRFENGRWQALTVFHGLLAEFDTTDSAVAHTSDHGLSSLQRRWLYRSASGEEWQTVLLQEVRPGRVRLVMGYYSLPGIPVIEVTAEDLAAGAQLTLRPA